MSVFRLTTGNDAFTGVIGQDNFFQFTPTTLQSADTIIGDTGSHFDYLTLGAAGTITIDQFAGVSNVEILELSGQLPGTGNTVTLTNGLVAGSRTGAFAILVNPGDHTVDASSITNGIRIQFFETRGTSVFKGSAGNDYFQLDGGFGGLASDDTVTGGAGFDTLVCGGVLPASAFTNVTGIELLSLRFGTDVTLTNAVVAGSSAGVFAVVAGSGNRVDASLVSDSNIVAFHATSGAFRTQTFIGGSVHNCYLFHPLELTSSDTVTGGAGFDALEFSGGTVGASAFTSVTNIEELILSRDGNNVTLTDGLVAGSSLLRFVVTDGGGDDIVDGSGITNNKGIAVLASTGNDTFIGSSGDDYFSFAAANLTASDTVTGGPGFDALELTSAGTVAAAAFNNVTGVDELILSDGNNVTLTDGLVAGSNLLRFVVIDGVGDDIVDGSGITNNKGIAVLASTGNDTFIGSGGDDYFSFAAANLTASDTVTGGTGFDALELTSAGTVAAAAFNNVTGIDELILCNGTNAITLNDQIVSSSDHQLFVVLDSTGNDMVDASAVTSGRLVFEARGGSDNINLGAATDIIHFSGLFGNDGVSGFFTGTDILEFDSAGDGTYDVDITPLGGNRFDLRASNAGGTVGEVTVFTTGGTLTASDLYIL